MMFDPHQWRCLFGILAGIPILMIAGTFKTIGQALLWFGCTAERVFDRVADWVKRDR